MMSTYTISLQSVLELTDDQFYELCQHNPDVKFERNAKGDLLIMSPTGGETSVHNAEISADFVIWNRQTKLGKVFDSSGGFKLPNGGERSPDVAWVLQERWDLGWDALTPEQQIKFPPIAPDFVLELLSPTDSLSATQAKMQEYMDSGVRLGWLINRKARSVEIYQQGQAVEVVQSPVTLSGEVVLPGFTLELAIVW